MEGIALLTKNAADRIALRGVKMTSRINGLTQRTTIEQSFVNLEDHAIEAVYTFPLPEDAAVYHLEVITADRVWTGQVQERDAAIQKYEDAIDDGEGAFLVEQERPDVFTIRVGNLKPQQAATIRLSYVAQMQVVDRTVRLCFPTTVAPRYVTTTATDALEAALANEVLNPPHLLQVPYGLTIDVELDLGRAVARIESPSHGIKTEALPEGRYRIGLAEASTVMDRDLVVTIGLQSEVEPHARVTRGAKGEHYVAVSFLPEFDSAAGAQPAEVFFVLDCSGSMAGESIEQAKRALDLCLRSMNAGDRFNICRFGSRHEFMSPEPLVYDSQTFQRAIDYVAKIGADLGGTELHPVLAEILKTPSVAGGIRQMILLTDGQISNEAEVIELVGRQRAGNRIFSFGIGSACSSHLVSGLARATGGVAEFITGNERIEEKVLRTFSRLASPQVTAIQIDWSGAEATVTPREMPGLFDGDALSVIARIQGGVPEQVTLSCQSAAGPKSWTVRVPTPSVDDGALALGWARRMLEDLAIIDGVRAQIRTRRTVSQAHRQALEIALEFNLLCSLTALVAVEHRSADKRNAGHPAIQRVPIQLAKGWGGVEVVDAALKDMSFEKAMPLESRNALEGSVSLYNSVRVRGLSPVPPSARRKQVTSGSTACSWSDLLYLQTAEGWFEWAPAFEPLLSQHMAGSSGGILKRLFKGASSAVEHCRKQVSAALQARIAGPVRPDETRVLHTLLAMFLLERAFASDEALWRRAADKALRWLAQHLTLSMEETRSLAQGIFAAVGSA